MNNTIIIFAATIITLAACSDNKGSESTIESDVEILSDADSTYMKEMLNSFGSPSNAIIIDDLNLDEVTPTDEPISQVSPIVYTFTTTKKIVYSQITSTGSCWVNTYNEENGISFYKAKKEQVPDNNTILEQSDNATIFLKENEGSLYKQDLHYKLYAGNIDYCVADSTAFVSECKGKGGIYKIYNKGCSSEGYLEASCVAKISNQTSLESIANTLKEECEAFVAELSEAEPIPTVYCQGDTENGLVCDTTRNEQGQSFASNDVQAFLKEQKQNTDTIKIMYDLTKFTKTFEDLKNDEDRWLYLLKHAGSAENLPDFNDDVIAKAINRLLVNKASDKLLKEQADDMVFTEEQLDRMALARVRARAIVLAEGEQKKARERARALKTMDVPIEKIVAASGLTQAEVEAL